MHIKLGKQAEKELKQFLELVNARAGNNYDASSLLSMMISTELMNALKLSEKQTKLN